MIGGDMIWVQHPDTKGRAEIPRDALAIYRQSGWEEMPDKDVAEMLEAADAERIKVEQAMSGESGAVLAADPAVPNPPAADDPAGADAAGDAPAGKDAAGKGRAAKTKES